MSSPKEDGFKRRLLLGGMQADNFFNKRKFSICYLTPFGGKTFMHVCVLGSLPPLLSSVRITQWLGMTVDVPLLRTINNHSGQHGE